MGFWTRFFDVFSTDLDNSDSHNFGCDINPASGLPMISGSCGIDVAGNPYGTDSTMDDTFSGSGLGSIDSFTSGSGWDDPFSGSSSPDTWSD